MRTISEYILNSGLIYPFCPVGEIVQPQEGKEPTRTAEFQNELKEYMMLKFGSLELISDVTTSVRCNIVYKANAYKYQTLWDTVIAKFNPLENYDMTEETTTTMRGGERVTTNKGGTDTNTTRYSGSESDTITYSGSERINESRNAKGENNETLGSTDRLDISAKSGFNETDLIDDNSMHSVVSTISNFRVNENTENFENEKTFDNRSDEHLKEFNNRVDSENVTHEEQGTQSSEYVNRVDTISHNRHGNIGVMSGQDLIRLSRDMADFSFIDIVAHDLIAEIAIAIYD